MLVDLHKVVVIVVDVILDGRDTVDVIRDGHDTDGLGWKAMNERIVTCKLSCMSRALGGRSLELKCWRDLMAVFRGSLRSVMVHFGSDW